MSVLTGSPFDGDRMFERLGKQIGVPIDADAIRKVADEQLRMIWTHMGVATIAATVFAMVFAAKMMTATNHAVIVGWMIAKLLVAFPRVMQGRAYRRHRRVEGRKWQDATDTLLGLDLSLIHI